MPGGVTGQHVYYSLSIHIVINPREPWATQVLHDIKMVIKWIHTSSIRYFQTSSSLL